MLLQQPFIIQPSRRWHFHSKIYNEHECWMTTNKQQAMANNKQTASLVFRWTSKIFRILQSIRRRWEISTFSQFRLEHRNVNKIQSAHKKKKTQRRNGIRSTRFFVWFFASYQFWLNLLQHLPLQSHILYLASTLAFVFWMENVGRNGNKWLISKVCFVGQL